MTTSELGHLCTGNHVGRTIYRQDPGEPRGVLVGVMDTPEYAAALVSAYNSRLEPGPIEEDLRKGFQESERRRKVAAVVAGYHRDCLAGHGAEADTDAVIAAFSAVLAALGGKTDPALLGVMDSPLVLNQVRVILDSQDGDRDA